MILKKIYPFQIFLSLLAIALMASCVDEKLTEENISPDVQSGESIALVLSLQTLTRSGDQSDFEEYEDYISPDMINLLFFFAEDIKDENGNLIMAANNTLIRQFSPRELAIIPIESTLDGSLKNWYVKLPALDDPKYAGFADVLRSHDFKVAALINWQKDKTVELEEAKFSHGQLFTLGDNINKLHHLSTDSKYKEGSVFGFLLEKSKIGMATVNWVKSPKNLNKADDNSDNKDDDRSAEYWIRNNWWDKKDVNKHESYREEYGDLWLLWNFDFALKGRDAVNTEPDFIKSKWIEKNQNDLKGWLETYKGTTNPLHSFIVEDKDNGNFEYVIKENSLTGAATVTQPQIGGEYGILLNPGYFDDNAFRFNMVASGTINIKWGRPEGSAGKIKIERRNQKDSPQAIKTYTLDNPAQKYPLNNKNEKEDLKITGDSEFISIFATDGEVIIYEIEYIASQYLYEIDRDPVAPSASQGIPMYGVQEYKKLGNFWKKGTLFNLSDFNNLSLVESGYEYRDRIYLLRSVAKVEVLIPKSFNAHHVMLRCLNRKAFNEPMDVSTPTNKIWTDNSLDLSKHPEDCEMKQLKGHLPFFDEEATKNEAVYKKKLAWYYGTWKNSDGNIGSGESVVEVPGTTEYGNTPIQAPNKESYAYDGNNPYIKNWLEYPHILNPRIERSDFVRFHEYGTYEGIYDRYVLYVPEKFVDDPNTDGDISDSPKVCHIEFRRSGMNGYDDDPWINLDDNNCYRLYFHENGYNPAYKPTLSQDVPGNSGTKQTWENTYEQKKENLKNHLPILRNHVYSFTVKDINQSVLVVELNVLPWVEVPQNSYNW